MLHDLELTGMPVHADLLLFTATANLSIVSLNLSLMLNRVGFYQACSHPHCALRTSSSILNCWIQWL